MKQIAALFIACVLTTSASAELIINGGFEDYDVPDTGNGVSIVDHNVVPGWESTNGKIEIWDGYDSYVASEGDQLVELNSISQTTLYQLFPTIAGHTYQLSYDFDARRTNNEKFAVEVTEFSRGFILGSNYKGVNSSPHSWESGGFQFVANSDVSKLSFISLVSSGVLLDDVSIISITDPVEFNDGTFLKDVPAPFAAALMALFPLLRRITKK